MDPHFQMTYNEAANGVTKSERKQIAEILNRRAIEQRD